MASVKLTEKFVASAKAADGEARTDYVDSGCANLALRVTQAGRKTWGFRYRVKVTGEHRRMTLGTYPALGLAAARTKAIDLRRLVEAGGDPAAEDKAGLSAARAEPLKTLDDLATAYFADCRAGDYRARKRQKALSTIVSEEGLYGRHLKKDLGGHRLEELSRDLLKRHLFAVKRKAPVQANRVHSLLSQFFSYAVKERERLQFNPMSAIAKPTDEKSRERVLKDAELSTIWRWLDSPSPLTFEEAGEQRNVTVGPTMASALRLAMLLPHRRAEVAGITGDEVDLSNSLWEVPEWRTKARKAHIVPLPPRSHELIKAALDMAVAAQKKWQKRNPDQAPGASVPAFPSPRDPRKSITAGSLSHAFNDLMKGLKINDATLHDLRRTASTNLTKAGFSEEIVGRVLTHAHEGGGSRVTQIYNRHAYLPEKQEALAAWEKILLGIVACSDPAQSNGNSAHISQEL